MAGTGSSENKCFPQGRSAWGDYCSVDVSQCQDPWNTDPVKRILPMHPSYYPEGTTQMRNLMYKFQSLFLWITVIIRIHIME